MRTLIYGLGNNFERNEKYVLTHYDNPISCDKNVARLNEFHDRTGQDIVALDELDIDSLSEIVLTQVDYVPDIVRDFHCKGAEYNKIKVLDYDLESDGVLQGNFAYGMKFYGQGGDDAILMFLFAQLNIPIENVRYLEIGTNDPLHYNNTYNFYRAGARGIIVDPMPSSKYLSSLIRPEDKFMQVAVSGDKYDPNRTITFYISSSSQGSSLDKSLIASVVEEIEVPLVDVNFLLSIQEADLLVIDAEGQDEAILRSLNYDVYMPVVIEAEVNKTQDENDLEQFIIDKGYYVYARTIANTLFVRNDKKQLTDRLFC